MFIMSSVLRLLLKSSLLGNNVSSNLFQLSTYSYGKIPLFNNKINLLISLLQNSYVFINLLIKSLLKCN